MRVLKSLRDAQVGQRLSFVYYGGSNPGEARDVTVTEVLDDRIYATDHNRDEEVRCFLFDKAALIVVVSEAPEQAAIEAVQRVVTPSGVGVRVRANSLSFVEARQRLIDQIEALSAEDLAEALAEVDGANRGTFDASTGMVTLEREVLTPHFKLNLDGDSAGVDVVNEDGDTTTIVTTQTNGVVSVTLNGQDVSPEEFALALCQHLGLTN